MPTCISALSHPQCWWLVVPAVGVGIAVTLSLAESPQPRKSRPSQSALRQLDVATTLATVTNEDPAPALRPVDLESRESLGEKEPVAATVMTPTAAMHLGLKGLPFFLPATTKAESEVLAHAIKGAWLYAVGAYLGHAARHDPLHGVWPDVATYLLRLRRTALFLTGDTALRALALDAALMANDPQGPTLIRAILFDANPTNVLLALENDHLLWLAPNQPDIVARLEALIEHEDPKVAVAAKTALEQYLTQPSRSTIGFGGSQFGHRMVRRARGTGRPKWPEPANADALAWTVADLPRLEQLLLTGNAEEQLLAAWVLAQWGWPESTALLGRGLKMTNENVRWYSQAGLLKIATPQALTLVARHFITEPSEPIRYQAANVILWQQFENLPDRIEFLLAVLRDSAWAVRRLGGMALEQPDLIPYSAPLARALIVDGLCQPRVADREVAFETINALVDWLLRNVEPDEMCFAAECVAYRADGATAAAVADALMSRGQFRSEREMVPYFVRLLGHKESEARIAVGRGLIAFFSDEAVAVLSQRVLYDTDDVLAATIKTLRLVIEDRRAVAWLIEVANARRTGVEPAILELLSLAGDTRLLPALTRVAESPVEKNREVAVTLMVPIGSRRQANSALTLIADPCDSVVLAACAATTRLLAIADVEPQDNLDELALRRVADRNAIYLLKLGRLAAGDADQAAWFVQRFPRLRYRFPTAPEELTPQRLADVTAAYLGLTLASAAPLELDLSGVPTTRLEFVDDEGNRHVYAVPSDYLTHVLAPALGSVKRKALPPSCYFRETFPRSNNDQ